MDKLLRDHNDIEVSLYFWEPMSDFAGHYYNGREERVMIREVGNSADWIGASRNTLVGRLDKVFGSGKELAMKEADDEAKVGFRDGLDGYHNN